MKDFIFKCPHCNADINFDEVKNHNKERLDEYFNTQKDEYIQTQKKEIESQLEKEKNLEIKLKESEFDKKLSLIKSQLDQANIEKEKIKEDAQKDIQIKMNAQMNALQNEISKLKDNANLQVENAKKDEQLKFEGEKLALIAKYQETIKELEIKNAEHKLIQNKTKGENFEFEYEGELRKCFGTYDRIIKANETVEGTKPDFLQYIKNRDEKEIGLIVHEVKNAKWSKAWEKKLYLDVAKNEGRFGILTATSFEEQFRGVPFIKSEKYDNIWICNSESFVFVSQMLRQIILLEDLYKQKTDELSKAISSSDNKQINELQIELENKKQKINDFLNIEIAKASQICETELENLEKISKTLVKQSDNIEQAYTRIRKQLFDNIIKRINDIVDM